MPACRQPVVLARSLIVFWTGTLAVGIDVPSLLAAPALAGTLPTPAPDEPLGHHDVDHPAGTHHDRAW